MNCSPSSSRLSHPPHRAGPQAMPPSPCHHCSADHLLCPGWVPHQLSVLTSMATLTPEGRLRPHTQVRLSYQKHQHLTASQVAPFPAAGLGCHCSQLQKILHPRNPATWRGEAGAAMAYGGGPPLLLRDTGQGWAGLLHSQPMLRPHRLAV